MDLKLKKTHPEAITPTRQRPGDSGLDLYAIIPDYGQVYIRAGERQLIRTGIAIELPEGFEAQVRPRSGLMSKRGVMAALGTIDNGYRGEIGVCLLNLSWEGYTVKHGERIAQLVVAPVVYPVPVVVDELSDTERGEGGYGSTGQ